MLWSKSKFSEGQAHAAGKKGAAGITEAEAKAQAEQRAVDAELVRLLKKRFEKSLPLHSINLIFIERAAARAFMAASAMDGTMDGDMNASHHEEE
jgi:hypothetical protein